MKRIKLDLAQLQPLPELEIGDRVFKVDSRRSNIKKMDEITAKIQGDGDAADDLAIVEVLIGKEGRDYIESLDLPMDSFAAVITALFELVQGENLQKLQDASFRNRAERRAKR